MHSDLRRGRLVRLALSIVGGALVAIAAVVALACLSVTGTSMAAEWAGLFTACMGMVLGFAAVASLLARRDRRVWFSALRRAAERARVTGA